MLLQTHEKRPQSELYSRCADLPDWFISFETVITVTVDADMQLIVDYMRNAYDG